jgi:hypothetical protein
VNCPLCREELQGEVLALLADARGSFPGGAKASDAATQSVGLAGIMERAAEVLDPIADALASIVDDLSATLAGFFGNDIQGIFNEDERANAVAAAAAAEEEDAAYLSAVVAALSSDESLPEAPSEPAFASPTASPGYLPGSDLAMALASFFT